MYTFTLRVAPGTRSLISMKILESFSQGDRVVISDEKDPTFNLSIGKGIFTKVGCF